MLAVVLQFEKKRSEKGSQKGASRRRLETPSSESTTP